MEYLRYKKISVALNKVFNVFAVDKIGILNNIGFPDKTFFVSNTLSCVDVHNLNIAVLFPMFVMVGPGNTTHFNNCFCIS